MGENRTLRKKIIDTESRIEVLGSRLNELRKECKLTHIKNKEIKLKKRMESMKKYGVATLPSEKGIVAVLNVLENNPKGLSYIELSSKTGYEYSGISLICTCLERTGKVKKEINRFGRFKAIKVSLINKDDAFATDGETQGEKKQ